MRYATGGMVKATPASRTPSHVSIGIDEVGRNVSERRQHEAALPHARMRNREVVASSTRVLSDEQDVDVEGARAPTLCAFTRRELLDLLTPMQELVGIEIRLDRDDRVEVRVLRRSADGRGLVDARDRDHTRRRERA